MKIGITKLIAAIFFVAFIVEGCSSFTTSSSQMTTGRGLPPAPRAENSKPTQASKKATTPSPAQKQPAQVATKEKPKEKAQEPTKEPVREAAPSKPNIAVENKDNPKLYAEIEKWHGTPHRVGGCTTAGIDCSCFTRTIYRDVYGIDLSRSSRDMIKDVEPVSRKDLKEGDLVFFKIRSRVITHVGIYLKNDTFVHSSTSNGVIISSLNDKYWNKYYFAGGRHNKVTTQY